MLPRFPIDNPPVFVEWNLRSYCFFLFGSITLWAETFAGGGIGVSVLSEAAKAAVDSNGTASSSLYHAGKGPIAHAFAGWRFHDYMAVQGQYVWTRNSIHIQSVRGAAFFQQQLNVAQNEFGADFLLFFRDRKSWIQPFLTVGIGVTRFSGAGDAARVNASKMGLRVAAGVDVMSRGAWGFRYAFLETIGGNPIAGALNPPAGQGLMTFKNLFGVIWRR